MQKNLVTAIDASHFILDVGQDFLVLRLETGRAHLVQQATSVVVKSGRVKAGRIAVSRSAVGGHFGTQRFLL